jgi:stress response protein YsnF
MMVYNPNTTQRDANLRSDTPVSTGIPFWDMMLSFGKASQQAMAGYATRGDHAPQPSYSAVHQSAVHQPTGSVEVIPVGEETLNVGTRLVAGETTRVRRVVVETPVEQAVSLREERVIVERRKPSAATAVATQGVLTESVIEMSDSFEVAEVWKSVRVTEEVVLRREVTERHETVRDTVRHDEVVVEHVNRALPAPRLEAVTAHASQPVATAPQASKPEPAQLAADLKKVAERFETNTEQHDKAPRAEAGPAKAEQKPAPVQSTKAVAEPPKPAARPETSAAPSDKSGTNQKH